MEKENVKMWEERYEKNPVIKEVIREHHHHSKSGGCNIF